MIYNFRIELLDNLTDFFNGFNRSDFVVGKHDADQAGVRLQGVRQLLRGDKPGGARRQQDYSETLRLQRL